MLRKVPVIKTIYRRTWDNVLVRKRYHEGKATMGITATQVRFHDIPQMYRLCDLGQFGRHMSVDGNKVTILVRDYRDDTRMSYTFEFSKSQGHRHDGLHLDWTNNYWDSHDYCFIPTDGDDIKLEDILSYCDYNANLGRSALADAGIDDDGFRVLVTEVLDALV